MTKSNKVLKGNLLAFGRLKRKRQRIGAFMLYYEPALIYPQH